jgi:hypothetical protein
MGKKLIDGVAVGESPAVVNPASEVDSVVVRARMESAGPARQTIQAAAGEPEELSASDGLGCARLMELPGSGRDTPVHAVSPAGIGLGQV